jgi:hypothetical protein
MKKHFILFMVLGLLVAGPAYADLFGFYNITGNSAIDAAIGEAQLSVSVEEYDTDEVLFTFLNAGSAASSITDIYFYDVENLTDFDALTGLIDADNGGDPGVNFSPFADPPNLPGANNASPPLVTSPSISFDSDPEVQPNGVNPGESLGIPFSLSTAVSFSDLINGIILGDLKIGIHVQGFESGGSESFVNNGPITNPVPEPATMLLLGGGLIGFAVVGKKKFFKK